MILVFDKSVELIYVGMSYTLAHSLLTNDRSTGLLLGIEHLSYTYFFVLVKLGL